MADFTKRRDESETFSIDFSAEIPDGESISSVDDVKVARYDGADEEWDDVSSEFGSPTGTKSGESVEVTLGVAGTGEQAGGSYVVTATVTTDAPETLSLSKTLFVDDLGDPDAP